MNFKLLFQIVFVVSIVLLTVLHFIPDKYVIPNIPNSTITVGEVSKIQEVGRYNTVMTVTFSFENREYFCNTKISSGLKAVIVKGTPIQVKFNKEDPLDNMIFPSNEKTPIDLDSNSILGTVMSVEEYTTNSVFKGRTKFKEVYFSYVNNDSIYSNAMVFDWGYKIGINDMYYLGKHKNINILDIRRKY